MKKLVSILLVAAMLFSMAACGSKDNSTQAPVTSTGDQNTTAAAGEQTTNTAEPIEYTTYTELYSSELKTLDYVDSTLTALTTFCNTCEAGLVYFDNFGLLRPGMAKSWSISDDGTVYTFYLRDDAWWVNSEGEKVEQVKAEDFVTAIRHILEDQTSVANTVYNNIVGAKEFYDDPSIGFDNVGVKALDEFTVQYTIKGALTYFLRMMGNNVWFPIPTEFFEEHKETFGLDHEELLYNGPYYCSSFEYEYERSFELNPYFFNYDKMTIGTVIMRYNLEATSNGPELFARGDTDRISSVNNAIAKEWLSDPEKKNLIRTNENNNMTYWIMFNYDPQFSDEYEPANWKKAVNTESFRQAMFYGFDTMNYNAVISEFTYEQNTVTTFTRVDLVNIGSTDYTQLSGLDEYSSKATNFDKEKALSYKEQAVADLTEKGVSFPVKIPVTYNTSATTNDRYQVLEQQLETLLGGDFIDIILVPYSGDNFNSEVRNAGNWAMLELGWGPDYVDPISQFDPIMKSAIGEKYGKLFLAEEYYIESLGYGEVEKIALEANDILNDNEARYKKFAEAEKLVLDHALLIPVYRGGGGYTASKLIPFSNMTGQFGDGGARNSVVLGIMADHPINDEEYKAYKEQYLADRDAAREAYEEESKAYLVPAQ